MICIAIIDSLLMATQPGAERSCGAQRRSAALGRGLLREGRRCRVVGGTCQACCGYRVRLEIPGSSCLINVSYVFATGDWGKHQVRQKGYVTSPIKKLYSHQHFSGCHQENSPEPTNLPLSYQQASTITNKHK